MVTLKEGLEFLAFTLTLAAGTRSAYRCREPERGIQSNVVVIGNEAHYNCKPGYIKQSGDYLRQCIKQRKWSGSALECVDGINCNGTLPCLHGTCIELDPSLECNCAGTKYFGALCDEAHGNWGQWSDTVECTATCDSGLIIRRRACDQPKPTANGNMCEGSAIETEKCDAERCDENIFKWCGRDKDMCQQNSGKGFCSHYWGKYNCSCLKGVRAVSERKWNGSFVRCEDIDECTDGTHTCDRKHGICVNVDSHFACTCRSGFSGDGHNCKDIDECTIGNHTCDENAKCYNRAGGYNCVCKHGYRSIADNGKGHKGYCKESRLLIHDHHENSTSFSLGTGEVVTNLIAIPSGFPLTNGAGNSFCESIYATENGVIVVTRLSPNADNNRRPTFRNPVDLTGANEDNVIGGKFHKYICAIIAPYWADAKFGRNSQLLSYVYDEEEWPGNQLKNPGSKGLEAWKIKKWHQYDRINKLLDENFIPNFVVVFTWIKMIPAWHAEANEEITYQSVVATDGTESFVINIYEDGAMSWRPVYNVPQDTLRYPATSGYVIFGKKIKKFQHPQSGEYAEGESNISSIYHFDLVSFNSTSLTGIDSYSMTGNQTVTNKTLCYKWYLDQNEPKIETQAIAEACPQTIGHMSIVEGILWRLTINMDDVKCYEWAFTLPGDEGRIDCCYSITDTIFDSPVISGMRDLDFGGFYHHDRQLDEKMREVCCRETGRQYLCDLFSRVRPSSNSRNYVHPFVASGVQNGTHVSVTSNISFVSATGSYQLLRVRNLGEPNFDIIGYFRDGLLVEIAMKYANYTFVVQTDGNSTICLLNTVPCQSFKDEVNLQLILADNPDDQATIAIRSGIVLNTTKVGRGLAYQLVLPATMVRNSSFTSGLLSSDQECYNMNADNQYEKAEAIPCDLASVALHSNSTRTKEYFFFGEYGTESDDELVSVTKGNATDFTANGIFDSKEILGGFDVATRNKSSPAVHPFVEAIAIDRNLYQVQLNATNFEGEINLNGTNMTLTGPGKYIAEIEVREDQRHVSITFTDQHGRRTSLHRPIVTCNCTDRQGSCVFPKLPEDEESTGLLIASEAACLCRKGFVGTTCAEIENPCAEKPCFDGVICTEISDSVKEESIDGVRTEKRYQCGACPDTLEKGNGETCYHDNPCVVPDSNNCTNAKCINLPSGYDCECENGFTPSDEKYVCDDYDECDIDGADHCKTMFATCINSPGSFSCECEMGYAMNISSGLCTDIDECIKANGGCDRRCNNFEGSYNCSCELGYALDVDGKTCKEIDECKAYGKDVCNQICDDSEVGQPFTCSCYENYYLLDDYRTCRANFTTIEQTEGPTTRFETSTYSTTTTTTTTTTTHSTQYTTVSYTSTVTQQRTSAPSTRAETTESTSTVAFTEIVTSIYDMLPDGWGIINASADEYTKTFQSLRMDLYLQMLQTSNFRDRSDASKNRIEEFIDVLSQLLSNPQSGRALAYLIAVDDSPYYSTWSREQHCSILSDSLLGNYDPTESTSSVTIARVMQENESNIKRILSIHSVETLLDSITVNFSMVAHLVALQARKVGVAGIDMNSDFKSTLGARDVDEIMLQFRRVNVCKDYSRRIRSTPPETKKTKIVEVTVMESNLTTEESTTSDAERIYQPPAWLAITLAISAIIFFALVLCTTKLCLTWKKKRKHRKEKEERKKRRLKEMRKSWPRYVDTEQSAFEADISRKLHLSNHQRHSIASGSRKISSRKSNHGSRRFKGKT